MLYEWFVHFLNGENRLQKRVIDSPIAFFKEGDCQDFDANL